MNDYQQKTPVFPPEITYLANFNEVGGNSLGGKIIITPEFLVFRPHSVNFGDLSDRVFEIRNITGYRKGFLTFFYISFAGGWEISLSVWKKQEIMDALESRRRVLLGI